ncbi:MAG: hypothetical protein ACK4L7_08260, partial [Flavobacteriales bacterium]
MGSKAIGRKPAGHPDHGLPKQQPFDLLTAGFPGARPRKVAGAVRYMPALRARERYRNPHLLLLAAIVALALMRAVPTLLQKDFAWEASCRLVSLVPIASLLLGWSIWRWQGQVFQWVGWSNVAGAAGMIKALTALNNGGGDAQQALQSALSVGIGASARYLAHQVFAEPKAEKDPLGGRCG